MHCINHVYLVHKNNNKHEENVLISSFCGSTMQLTEGKCSDDYIRNDTERSVKK